MITELSTYKLIKELIILEKKLDEGLIMTHDIHDSIDIIKHTFNFNNIIDIRPERNKIILDINNDNLQIDTNKFSEFLVLVTNLGYYVAKIKLTNKNNNEYNTKLNNFKDNYFNDNSFKNIIKYEIVLEPKFDTKHQLKTNTIYHVTEEKYLDRIFSNGLIAKSKNTLTNYPERIYFTYNIDDSEQYILNKSKYYIRNKIKEPIESKYNDTKFVILEIKVTENDDIIFYEDPNFKGKGIYTYDNINKSNIIVVD